MVTAAPERVSSRQASTIALRVRSFCRTRPPPSPGGFLLLSGSVTAISAPPALMMVISLDESVLA